MSRNNKAKKPNQKANWNPNANQTKSTGVPGPEMQGKGKNGSEKTKYDQQRPQ